MAGVSADFSGLDAWRRAEVSRHLGQTRHLHYGGLERSEAMYFRLPLGDPAVIRTEPPAVFLAQLRDAAAAGGQVRLAKMSKADGIRTSDALRQTADRAAREAKDAQVTEFLSQLARRWDDMQRLPQDAYNREEHLAVDALGRGRGRDSARAQPAREIVISE